MLQRFPVESKGRRKKLQEVSSNISISVLKWSSILTFLFLFLFIQVGYVTTICFSCFLIRSIMVSYSLFWGNFVFQSYKYSSRIGMAKVIGLFGYLEIMYIWWLDNHENVDNWVDSLRTNLRLFNCNDTLIYGILIGEVWRKINLKKALFAPSTICLRINCNLIFLPIWKLL